MFERADLAVGANRDDTGGTDRGAVYVLLLNSNGTVKGKVMFGDRAQKADVTVWLMSKDGKTVVKDTKVTAEGIFEIKDVPAGDYVLYAEQKTSGKPIAGTASVTIKEGPPVTEQNVVLKK